MTHATFFENDYMNNFKPRSKMLLEEMSGVSSFTNPTKVVVLREELGLDPESTRVAETENKSREVIDDSQKVIESRRSGRIRRPPKR